jgi:hypothetical protein
MYVYMYVHTPRTPSPTRPPLPTHAGDGVIEIYHGHRYLHGAAEERSGLVQKGKEGRVAGPGIVVISQFRNPRTEKLLVRVYFRNPKEKRVHQMGGIMRCFLWVA